METDNRHHPTPAEAAAARQEQFDRDRQRRADRDLAAVKGELRRRYLAVPGADPDRFEDEFPRLLDQHRQHQAVTGTATGPSDVPFSDPQRWGLKR